MKYSLHLPLFVISYLLITAVYTLTDLNGVWLDVFWASYKNLTLVGCLYFINQARRLLWIDKFIIRICIVVNLVQTSMYLLCPFSTKEQIGSYFALFGWFVILMLGSCIIFYLKELWKQP